MLLSLFEMMYGRIYTASALKPFAETDKRLNIHLQNIWQKCELAKYSQNSLCSAGTCEAETKVVPGDWVLINSLQRNHCHLPKWDRPYKVLLSTSITVKIAERATWIHLTHCKRVSLPYKETENRSCLPLQFSAQKYSTAVGFSRSRSRTSKCGLFAR